MSASLDEKLRNVKWGEYRVDQLFELQKVTKMLSKDDLSDEYQYPAYSSESINNGIIGYTDSPEFICDENHPVFIIFGDHTRLFHVAQKSFSVLDNVKVLLPTTNCVRSLLWMIATWKKQIPDMGYNRHWKIAKECIIQLPTKNGKIDFDFMESFIVELEAERFVSLSAYLTESGLNNPELTANEVDSINRLPLVQWKEYRMGDLFDKIKTKRLPYQAKELPNTPTDEFVLPCLTSSFQNQGLNYYAPKSGATILKNVISIPSNSDVYRAYFQPIDFTVLSDAYAIQWKYRSKDLSPNQYLFLVGCINKVTDRPIYSHKNKLGGWNVVKNKYIQLPQVDGKIDFAYMEILISAIQKLLVKNVVRYVDKRVVATKENSIEEKTE